MKTYHMYHTESISAESKLKEAEKQEEKQIGRVGDPVFHIRLEDRHQRRSSVKKIEKMKEKVNKKWSLVIHNMTMMSHPLKLSVQRIKSELLKVIKFSRPIGFIESGE